MLGARENCARGSPDRPPIIYGKDARGCSRTILAEYRGGASEKAHAQISHKFLLEFDIFTGSKLYGQKRISILELCGLKTSVLERLCKDVCARRPWHKLRRSQMRLAPDCHFSSSSRLAGRKLCYKNIMSLRLYFCVGCHYAKKFSLRFLN